MSQFLGINNDTFEHIVAEEDGTIFKYSVDDVIGPIELTQEQADKIIDSPEWEDVDSFVPGANYVHFTAKILKTQKINLIEGQRRSKYLLDECKVGMENIKEVKAAYEEAMLHLITDSTGQVKVDLLDLRAETLKRVKDAERAELLKNANLKIERWLDKHKKYDKKIIDAIKSDTLSDDMIEEYQDLMATLFEEDTVPRSINDNSRLEQFHKRTMAEIAEYQKTKKSELLSKHASDILHEVFIAGLKDEPESLDDMLINDTLKKIEAEDNV